MGPRWTREVRQDALNVITDSTNVLQVPTTLAKIAKINIELKIVELTADVLEIFSTKQYDPSHYDKTHPHSILQVRTTQLAKMSIDSKFVELTADVLGIFL